MIVVAIDDLKGVVLYLIGVIATLSIFRDFADVGADHRGHHRPRNWVRCPERR